MGIFTTPYIEIFFISKFRANVPMLWPLIPLDIQQNWLPSQSLSIPEFLLFRVPSIISAKLRDTEFYLSNKSPDASLDDINTMLSNSLPSKPILKDLINCIESSSSTAKSVAHESISKSFPLWIITYWHKTYDIHDNQQLWRQADRTLQALRTQGAGSLELVDQVYKALAWLLWSGSVQGFSDGGNIIQLHQYITSDWLRTVHENQMLDLLRHDINNHRADSTEITIQDTYFLEALCQAFRHRKHRQPKSSRPGSFNFIAESLTSGKYTQLGTIMNYEGIHWFALVLDFPNQVIWYGDSLDFEMEKELKQALEWWIKGVTFTYKKMLITRQKDTFSCGLLAWIALCHYFLPKRHPLIDPGNVAAARLKVLLRVCERHRDQVSNY
jgi:hypothetical protein